MPTLPHPASSSPPVRPDSPAFGVREAVSTVRAAIATLTERVAQAERAVEAGAGAAALGGQDAIEAALTGLDTCASILNVTRTRYATAAATTRTRAGTDPRDAITHRATSTRQGLGAAKAEAAAGATLQLLPTVREATATGTVSEGHIRAISSVLSGVSDATRDRLAREEAEILQRATQATVPELRKELRARAAAIEADQADRDHHTARENRRLHLLTRHGGVQIDGFLDPIAGATLRTALDALTPTPATGDTRTPEQRRADALIHLADHALSIGDARTGAQVRPHLSILIREDTWHLLTHRRRLACTQRTGASTGDVFHRNAEAFAASGLSEEPPLAQLVDGTLIPYAALDVLACDALMQRLVLDPGGIPLNLGRTQRTYTGDLRRAILVRDRHCQYPDCPIRAEWCEVHHILEWDNHGDTSLTNGITLCSRHHHEVHDRNLRITPTATGFTFTTPTVRALGTTTRLHDRLLIPRASRPHQAARAPGRGTGSTWRERRTPHDTPPDSPPGAPPGEPPGAPPGAPPDSPPAPPTTSDTLADDRTAPTLFDT
ncbi:HNH endonuclease signature motif containing protein [Serinibacter salmoneus]|uniref:HNH endonuclease signature motif containing protein n=1 Tax=Serinibacter salmoneus TaxID=556530 RepID=UPI001473E616|nr:HNH endonuclease signature motif containing protein [Serinibacter salmoneus]